MTRTSDELAVNISEAASDALDMPIEELPSLSNAVEMDALEEIITSQTAQPSQVVVTFTYAELRISVWSEGTIYVRSQHSDVVAQ